jgi:hypothetical protein
MTTTTLQDIEKLAQKTANEALKEDTPLQSRIDALKVLSPYYSALKKVEPDDEDEPGEPTMDKMRSQIEQENGNGRAVQTRSRSRN